MFYLEAIAMSFINVFVFATKHVEKNQLMILQTLQVNVSIGSPSKLIKIP